MFDITPKKLLREIDNSSKRLAPFRKARYLFIRATVGQYYNTTRWNHGEEPLNLIANAIRVLVPNLVMNYPKVVISTKDLTQRQYAELLGLGLDDLAQAIHLKDTLRRWVIDSLYGLATMKVGLCTRETIRDGSDESDPTMVLTQPYADTVDFDDLILDPSCRRREEAALIGNHVLVERQLLLDSGLYDNAVVEKLPSVLETLPKKEVRELSQQPNVNDVTNRLQNLVNLAEVWIPSERAIFTVPGHKNAGSDGDKYLCEPQEAYCLDDGPYVFLSVTPPVPDNPLPVAPVGLWYDLADRANEMLSKMMDQASAQKDIALAKRGMEDDADLIRNSQNLDVLMVDDPNLFQKMSLGGQNPQNERMLGQLMMLFSQMAGNIEQLAGNRSDADSATQATILQQNSMVSVEDMRDIVYDGTAEIYRRLGWYLHTDPLIDVPLIRRSKDENGRVVEEPVQLTPEIRRGDYFNFMFKIKLKSMSRLDPQTRIQRMMQLFTNVIPGLTQSALAMWQMQIPFDLQAAIVRAAHELGLEWLDDIFGSPEIMQKIQLMNQLGQQMGNSKGSLAGAVQNQGNPMAMNIPSVATEQRQMAQLPTADMQADLKGGVA
jgi:hypothetical protein